MNIFNAVLWTVRKQRDFRPIRRINVEKYFGSHSKPYHFISCKRIDVKSF